MNATKGRDRITARVSQPIATKLKLAADLTGATLNQFLVQAAIEKADRIIDHEHTIRFSSEDAALFIKMLDNPTPPNADLTVAFERRKNKAKKCPRYRPIAGSRAHLQRPLTPIGDISIVKA